MPILSWDNLADRQYETGLDRGVLYLPDGSAVPWNGLTGIDEKMDNQITPVYYDGMKIHDVVSIGDFTATLHALTYPDEFLNFEGLQAIKPGFFVAEQPPMMFALSYRTKIGSALDSDLGYKIHILYNVVAIPNDKTYASTAADPGSTELVWDIYPVPAELPGYRPTSHFVINTVDLDPLLLEQVEAQLYGSDTAVASLLSMTDMAAFIASWYRVQITDNGDGTWTATSPINGVVVDNGDGTFEIDQANVVMLNVDTYQLSDTKTLTDIT